MPEYPRGPVAVRVPATSANLGPGYDSLGLALSIYDEVTAHVVDGETTVTVEGEGAGVLPSTAEHLVAASLRTAAARAGAVAPPVAIHCRNAIPQARGLGSSSAAIVAGVLLADEICQLSLDAEAVLGLAAAIEGHPDNVAPCVLGGFTVAWTIEDAAKAISREVANGLFPVVYVPEGHGLTSTARAVLPREVPHADAAFNVARAALAVCAFTTDTSLLFDATDDRLHQTYRAESIPNSAQLVSRLRDARIPAMISGAGPTVLAFTANPPQATGFDLRKVKIGDAARVIGRRRATQVLPSA